MEWKKKLPIGIENFEKIQTQGFYYADKTGLLIELLHNWGEVNLFTRPRRFGKSLNMSMLQTFFEIGCRKELFAGLKIEKEKELCEEYMGKFPVVSVSLKGVDGLCYQDACAALKGIIGMEAMRFLFLKESTVLSDEDKMLYGQLIRVGQQQDGMFDITLDTLETSLRTLTQLLSKHYGRKVILLIDEYDVPLDKAFQAGYYEEMVSLIRNLFSNALKTNPHLQFAVLTGCLRISKESIFTGLNNLNVMTITDEYFSDSFGFTENEVKELLSYYGCEETLGTVREWYDGYYFGKTSVYCPWDVIKYCQALIKNKEAVPQNYWANTSGNAMVRRFISMADKQTKDEIELLIEGGSIKKRVNQELTYSELDKSIDNLWSVLFTTGYLTQRGQTGRTGHTDDDTCYELVIPNREIKNLFVTQIREWFQETAVSNTEQIEAFCTAFPNGDAPAVEEMLNDYLWESISIRDTAVRNEFKENFYHGMLLGLLGYKRNWKIKSNVESGEGYSDILIETPKRIGVVIELKYAQDGRLDPWCEKALAQIENKHYDAVLEDDGMKTIVTYGIAFYKKRCRVMMAELPETNS